MWFLLFVIIIPFVLFVGFYLFSVIAIFSINRIFHKKYPQYLSLILPCCSCVFYFALITGGISFKYIDPQYYEFKRLCEKSINEKIVYNKELSRIYIALDAQTSYPQSYYDKKTQHEYFMKDFRKKDDSNLQKISSRITELQNILYYKDNKNPLLYYKQYYYKYYGIFLGGDKGAGFYINFDGKVLECNGS